MPRAKQVLSENPQAKCTSQSTHLAKKLLPLSSVVTWADVMLLYLDMSLAFSHSKNLMPSFVYGSRPKWQYAAVSWYLGSRSANDCAMAPGRQSKAILMTLVISSADKSPCSVPYVSTNRDNGFATPIAYDNCTRARLQRPLLTTDLAICLQM